MSRGLPTIDAHTIRAYSEDTLYIPFCIGEHFVVH